VDLAIVTLITGTIAAVGVADWRAMMLHSVGLPRILLAAVVLEQNDVAKGGGNQAEDHDVVEFHGLLFGVVVVLVMRLWLDRAVDRFSTSPTDLGYSRADFYPAPPQKCPANSPKPPAEQGQCPATSR
jgi:hypothetical protein